MICQNVSCEKDVLCHVSEVLQQYQSSCHYTPPIKQDRGYL